MRPFVLKLKILSFAVVVSFLVNDEKFFSLKKRDRFFFGLDR